MVEKEKLLNQKEDNVKIVTGLTSIWWWMEWIGWTSRKHNFSRWIEVACSYCRFGDVMHIEENNKVCIKYKIGKILDHLVYQAKMN